mmetsp:Transcript_21351/g.67478  ORF Transcript_21351/g.67478 Transcript_21351/m.67478 type:complete len:223 (-) Transcript_21351:1294-1962(-)
MQVPQHACEICSIHVCVRVSYVALGTVNVKGILVCAAILGVGLLQLALCWRQVVKVVVPGDSRVALSDLLHHPKLAAMRDGLHLDLVASKREVHEAILIIRSVVVWCALRSHASAAPRYDPGGAAHEVGVEARPAIYDTQRVVGNVYLLLVLVACDHDVDAVVPRDVWPLVFSPSGREMRDDDLPVGRGLVQSLLEPSLLVFPEFSEPRRAMVRRNRALLTA